MIATNDARGLMNRIYESCIKLLKHFWLSFHCWRRTIAPSSMTDESCAACHDVPTALPVVVRLFSTSWVASCFFCFICCVSFWIRFALC